MPAILIVAHVPLASSLKAVAQHVYPDCSRHLGAVDVMPGASLDSAQGLVRQAMADLNVTDVLVLTDVFGATPCNAAMAATDGLHSRVVAGVNVPMLWRTLCYADLPLEELVRRAVAGATQGVMQVSSPRRQNQGPTVGSHDQDKEAHQQ